MKRSVVASCVLLLAAISFWAGFRIGGGGATEPGEGGRRVLYYVDPMNPGFRSESPGIAPCGMPLEPVYADEGPAGGMAAATPAGTVRVPGAKRQAMGVRTVSAERKAARHTVRLFGRVAVDETRVYRFEAISQGWVRQAAKVSEGSVVAKGDLLAVYAGQEIIGPQQAFVYAVETIDNLKAAGAAEAQIAQEMRNVDAARRVLRNLGMVDEQIDELARTRQVSQGLSVRAPVTGVVLARSGSASGESMGGQYVVADLDRVWVLAETYGAEAALFRPGATARVRVPGAASVVEARVAPAEFAYDPETRAVQVRLEADNARHLLRPDMRVDVEIDVDRAAAVVVPEDALIETGRTTQAFVEVADGLFEPRPVDVGWRHGGEVEIRDGIAAADRVVVAGAFLLDSESRMKAVGPAPEAAPRAAGPARDPICDMEVDVAQARARGLVSVLAGAEVVFCSPGCKAAFDADPEAARKRSGE
jgi:YHS domain-containing protein